MPITYFSAKFLETNTRQEIASLQKNLDNNAQLLAKKALLRAVKADLNHILSSNQIINILNNIASVLPKTTWITSVRYENGQLHLSGNSPNTLNMMKELNKLPRIGHIELSSVANSDSITPSQFEVSIDVKQ